MKKNSPDCLCRVGWNSIRDHGWGSPYRHLRPKNLDGFVDNSYPPESAAVTKIAAGDLGVECLPCSSQERKCQCPRFNSIACILSLLPELVGDHPCEYYSPPSFSRYLLLRRIRLRSILLRSSTTTRVSPSM